MVLTAMNAFTHADKTSDCGARPMKTFCTVCKVYLCEVCFTTPSPSAHHEFHAEASVHASNEVDKVRASKKLILDIYELNYCNQTTLAQITARRNWCDSSVEICVCFNNCFPEQICAMQCRKCRGVLETNRRAEDERKQEKWLWALKLIVPYGLESNPGSPGSWESTLCTCAYQDLC